MGEQLNKWINVTNLSVFLISFVSRVRHIKLCGELKPE